MQQNSGTCKNVFSTFAITAALAATTTLSNAEPIPNPLPFPGMTEAVQIGNASDLLGLDGIHLDKRGVSSNFMILSWDPALDLRCVGDQDPTSYPGPVVKLKYCNIYDAAQTMYYNDADKSIRMVSRGTSNICLEAGSSLGSGVFTNWCYGGTRQKWYYNYQEGLFRMFDNRAQCLDKGSGGSSSITIQTCSTTNVNQQFNTYLAANQYGKTQMVRLSASNLCLTSQGLNNQLKWTTCSFAASQQFNWHPGCWYLMLAGTNPNQCVTWENDGSYSLKLRNCVYYSGSPWVSYFQQWYPADGRSKSPVNYQNCMAASSTSSGANAQSWDCWNTAANQVQVEWLLPQSAGLILQKRALSVSYSGRTFSSGKTAWTL